MARLILSDAQWERIKPMLPDHTTRRGRPGDDSRLFVEAVLWLARTGAPWRNLPEEFGKWNTVYRRFVRWEGRGVWDRVAEELEKDPDFERAFSASETPP